MEASKDRDIVVFGYQFGEPAGAKEFAATVLRTGLEQRGGVMQKPLAVPGIPDAAGFESTSDGVTSRTVVFAKGDYVAMVLINAKEGDAGAPTLADVAKQQYDLL